MISRISDLGQWSTPSIVDRFIALLSPFGFMDIGDFLPIPGLDNKSNDYRAALEEARVLAEELKRRADPVAGDRLWNNLNPAVRLGMFSLLMPNTPRGALFASMVGPLSGLPDEKAGELYLNALTTKEERVPLKDMTSEELLDRFLEFCLRNFMAWNFFNLHDDQEEIDASNDIITEIMRILVAMKERGLLGKLLPLLKHENQNVRLWAADGTLFVDEEAAVATLAAIADEGPPESARMFSAGGRCLTNISALDSLKRWRKEKRGIYGLNAGDKPAN